METVENDPISGFLSENGTSVFDIVFCFSTTMYIHLINGDEGLKSFLTLLCTLGNYIVLEPQPFKKYRHHRERMKKENKEKGPHDPYPLFPEKQGQIKWRHDLEKEICSFVKEQGFELVYTSKSEDWDRHIFIFKRIKS
jgi:hypothetical protein